MSDYSITLSTTEPNNYVGLIKLRQGDVASQSIQATITANGQLFKFDNLSVFFNAVLPNGNVIRDKVTEVDYINSKLNYIVADSFLQEVAQVTAWFSFENDEKIIDSTKNFQYSVIAGWKECIPQGNYIYELSEIQREIEQIIGNKDFTTLLSELDFLKTNISYLDNNFKTIKADLNNSINDKLSQISSVPETFANLSVLKSTYPNGKTGLFVTADTGHKFIWANGTWTDAGVYQSAGIADDQKDVIRQYILNFDNLIKNGDFLNGDMSSLSHNAGTSLTSSAFDNLNWANVIGNVNQGNTDSYFKVPVSGNTAWIKFTQLKFDCDINSTKISNLRVFVDVFFTEGQSRTILINQFTVQPNQHNTISALTPIINSLIPDGKTIAYINIGIASLDDDVDYRIAKCKIVQYRQPVNGENLVKNYEINQKDNLVTDSQLLTNAPNLRVTNGTVSVVQMNGRNWNQITTVDKTKSTNAFYSLYKSSLNYPLSNFINRKWLFKGTLLCNTDSDYMLYCDAYDQAGVLQRITVGSVHIYANKEKSFEVETPTLAESTFSGTDVTSVNFVITTLDPNVVTNVTDIFIKPFAPNQKKATLDYFEKDAIAKYGTSLVGHDGSVKTVVREFSKLNWINATPTAPSSGWTSNVPTVPGNDGIAGLQGKDGQQGVPGPKGADGKTQYTHIAYANSADGTANFSTSDSNRTYIGMYVDFNINDSTTPSDYSWTLVKGADGTQGTPGKAAADGKTPYFHTAWSYNADGTNGFTTVYPNLNLLSLSSVQIGQYLNWSNGLDLFGNANRAVFDYIQVTPNQTYTLSSSWNGWYISVFGYSDKTSSAKYILTGGKMQPITGSGFSESQNVTFTVPADCNYLRVHIGHDSINTSASVVKSVKVKIEPGSTATPYMPSSSEATTADWPSYIGQYTDFTSADSTNPSAYTWSLIRGNDGKDGANEIYLRVPKPNNIYAFKGYYWSSIRLGLAIVSEANENFTLRLDIVDNAGKITSKELGVYYVITNQRYDVKVDTPLIYQVYKSDPSNIAEIRFVISPENKIAGYNTGNYSITFHDNYSPQADTMFSPYLIPYNLDSGFIAKSGITKTDILENNVRKLSIKCVAGQTNTDPYATDLYTERLNLPDYLGKRWQEHLVFEPDIDCIVTTQLDFFDDNGKYVKTTVLGKHRVLAWQKVVLNDVTPKLSEVVSVPYPNIHFSIKTDMPQDTLSYKISDFYIKEYIPEALSSPTQSTSGASKLPELRLYGKVPQTATDKTTVSFKFVSGSLENEGYTTLAWQGQSSKGLAKKSYKLKTYTDSGLSKKLKMQIDPTFDSASKFTLKASYSDKTFSLDSTANEVIHDMVITRHTTSEHLSKSDYLGQNKGRAVMLYVNDTFAGLYFMRSGSKEDTYGMTDDDPNQFVVEGETEHGAAMFQAPHVTVWDDGSGSVNIEFAPTIPDKLSDEQKKAFDNFVNMVYTGDLPTFKSSLTPEALHSAIDYIIFYNLFGNVDSCGRNLEWATWDGGKHFMVIPYDFDQTMFNAWNGLSVGDATADGFPVKQMRFGTTTNKYFDLIAQAYPDEIKARYAELRSGLLREDNVLSRYTKFMKQIDVENYAKEMELWPRETVIDYPYISNFINTRFKLVDQQIKTHLG